MCVCVCVRAFAFACDMSYYDRSGKPATQILDHLPPAIVSLSLSLSLSLCVCVLTEHCSIFEINPDASAFFKFTDGYETTDEALYKQELFKKHSTGVISNVTAAVGLLEKGDMDTLTTVLKELGQKHLAYGLKLQKAHYDLVGQALIDTLSTALGEDFTDDVKNAWIGVYGVIATTMMAGAAELDENDENEEEKKEDEPPQYYVDPNTLVVSSWDKIKAIENYKTVAGQLLFKR